MVPDQLYLDKGCHCSNKQATKQADYTSVHWKHKMWAFIDSSRFIDVKQIHNLS